MNQLILNIYRQPGVLAIIGLLAVSSCKLNQEYQRAEFSHPDLYRDISTDDTTGISDIPWKEIFTDTLLQSLIEEGLAANNDLEVAVARIKSSEAVLLEQKGALFPSLDISGSASFSKLANTISVASGFATQQYQLYGTASWELDVWGKLRSAKRSAMADLLASEAYRRTVQTQLIADIANSYYSLMALDEQLTITRQNVSYLTEYEETIQELKKASSVTGADLMQSKANRYSSQVLLPDIKQQIRETENALSILLARDPGPIKRNQLLDQQPQMSLSTGVPSLLLSHRPDVQEAEFGVRSAFEMVNASRAYFYPSITLSGSGGFATQDISELFDPSSIFGNVAAGLLQPVLSNNANKARLKSYKAAQQEAVATFEQTLLTAGEEVSNALYAYQMAEEKMATRTEQVAALNKAVEFNQELLKYSEADYLDVLTAQQSLISAQLDGIDDRLQKMGAMIELYRALGGGWQ